MKRSNQCPDCGGDGYCISRPGARPLYRCYACKLVFGG